MAKPAKKLTIEPSIQVVGGKEHAIVTLFKGEDENLPVIKSVGYMKVPGTNTYVSFTLTTKGTEVLKMEVEEPNLRAIAEESAKIAFVNNFMSVEEF